MANSSDLKTSYPWIRSPLIVGAPMGGGIASPKLAVEITKAGGIGFVGGGYDMKSVSKWLGEAKDLLASSSVAKDSKTLPVGIGFLCFGVDVDEAVDAVRQNKPVAVWLFAAKQIKDYGSWTEKIRKACPETTIWVQTGSVGDGVEIAKTCKPDVIVCQGLDAGGHGLEKGAGVVSLIPEMADTLRSNGFNIPLIATGGIVDGRGVAASVVLGAVGAAMGTRFLASEEAKVVDGYRDAVVKASDGGQATVRDKVFDDLNPAGNIWPPAYDGRSLLNDSWKDKKSGIDIDENRKRQAQALKENDGGFDWEHMRANAWVGTGVGIVKEVQPAAKIVEDIRTRAQEVINGLKAKI